MPETAPKTTLSTQDIEALGYRDARKETTDIEPPDIMRELYKVVCRQTDCSGRGFAENDCGKCAFCADTADDVIGTYFKLKAQKAWSSSL